MHLVLGLVIGFMGTLQFGVSGGLFGGLVGVLTAEVLLLRKRLGQLEEAEGAKKTAIKEPSQEVVFKPAAEKKVTAGRTTGKIVQKPAAAVKPVPQQKEKSKTKRKDSAFDSYLAGLSGQAKELTQKVADFFTSGNLVLKIGIIILFFGMAFLLKYAAQRNMVPIEFRLIGVALSGIGLLGVGWWLRHRRLGYGLILQGGGVGILYLVVFASAKLYSFLPMTLSLVVMVGLVALSCMLAVLQESKALAVFGIIGGFLAPVLMSTGAGSHVMLFSYYALLNTGILGIAWFKSWRELNLLGFIFTFAIGTLWGHSGYRPEHFWSTELFLLLFFVFYVLISIFFAYRQPINLRGFIDGPLVFGLPLIVSGLQYYLVKDFQYGMAFSALGLGLFYLGLAIFLWRKLLHSLHLLCEAFLSLGVVFGSLAIPLALDAHLSASIWALEGSGMVWVGLRQKRLLARHFGLLLQICAAVIFLDSVWYPLSATPFANRFFLGCLFISAGAFFSSYCLDKYKNELKKWEKYFPLPLVIWGLVWWYIAGLREVDKQMSHSEQEAGVLMFCCVTSILSGITLKKLQWPRLVLALYLQLPVMVLVAASGFLDLHSNFHFLKGWGAVAWIVAFVIQYRVLYLFAEDWPRRNHNYWHLGTLWLLIFVFCIESSWAVRQVAGIGEVWEIVCWAFIPVAALLLLLNLGKGLSWPVGKHSSCYLGAGGSLPILGLITWSVFSLALPGDPVPLPYLPLVNPLEISGLVVIITLLLWVLSTSNRGQTFRFFSQKQALWCLSILFFLWLNSVVARSVHFYTGIPYHPESLYHSAIFQAALAAVWGFGALAMTVWATRKGSRTLWGVGAALLGMVVLKLFLVDLSGTGTIARIVSFLIVGVLMLIIGYFSPIPPKNEEKAL